eukprot:Pgem_evm1s20118
MSMVAEERPGTVKPAPEIDPRPDASIVIELPDSPESRFLLLLSEYIIPSKSPAFAGVISGMISCIEILLEGSPET